MKKPFGTELLLDLYECDPKAIDDINTCYYFLDQAVTVMKTHKQAPPFVFKSPDSFPDKAGISAWVPLIESGIQLHTLSVRKFVSIDYYTCSDVTEEVKENLIKLAQETFLPHRIDDQVLFRGKDYFTE